MERTALRRRYNDDQATMSVRSCPRSRRAGGGVSLDADAFSTMEGLQVDCIHEVHSGAQLRRWLVY